MSFASRMYSLSQAVRHKLDSYPSMFSRMETPRAYVGSTADAGMERRTGGQTGFSILKGESQRLVEMNAGRSFGDFVVARRALTNMEAARTAVAGIGVAIPMMPTNVDEPHVNRKPAHRFAPPNFSRPLSTQASRATPYKPAHKGEFGSQKPRHSTKRPPNPSRKVRPARPGLYRSNAVRYKRRESEEPTRAQVAPSSTASNAMFASEVFVPKPLLRRHGRMFDPGG